MSGSYGGGGAGGGYGGRGGGGGGYSNGYDRNGGGYSNNYSSHGYDVLARTCSFPLSLHHVSCALRLMRFISKSNR